MGVAGGVFPLAFALLGTAAPDRAASAWAWSAPCSAWPVPWAARGRPGRRILRLPGLFGFGGYGGRLVVAIATLVPDRAAAVAAGSTWIGATLHIPSLTTEPARGKPG